MLQTPLFKTFLSQETRVIWSLTRPEDVVWEIQTERSALVVNSRLKNYSEVHVNLITFQSSPKANWSLKQLDNYFCAYQQSWDSLITNYIVKPDFYASVAMILLLSQESGYCIAQNLVSFLQVKTNPYRHRLKQTLLFFDKTVVTLISPLCSHMLRQVFLWVILL